MAKPPKFGNNNATQAKLSELGPKLEVIACGIADELITGTESLKGQLNITDKCSVLKTLTAYYGMVNKVEVPEELGGAFDKYRKGISAQNTGGGGSSDGNSGDAAGAFDPNVIPISRAAGGNRAARRDAEDDRGDYDE